MQVVPGTAGRIETAARPSWGDDRIDAVLAEIVAGEVARGTALPAPDASAFDTGYLPRQRIMLADRSAGARYLALAAGAEWSDPAKAALSASQAELAAPDIRDVGLALLELPDGAQILGVSPTIPLPTTDKTNGAEAPTPGAPQE